MRLINIHSLAIYHDIAHSTFAQVIEEHRKNKKLKGSVQRKLRWVENGVIRWVWAPHCGTEYYFVNLGGLHLVYDFFPLPVSTARIIGEFWKNR